MKQLLLFCLALTLSQIANAKDVFVNTPKTTLMLAVNEGQTPRIHYYGSRIRPEQAHEVYDAMSINYDAYPAFGRNSFDETALSVTGMYALEICFYLLNQLYSQLLQM